MANIKLLVGTVYGNALELAEICADQLRSEGHLVSIARQSQIEDVMDAEVDVFLIVTSTTGQGEIPDTLLMLYCQLKDRLPILPAKYYGVIALGDSSYDNFAEAGCLMDGLFQELKLTRLDEILFIDACETMAPEEEALPWVVKWESLLPNRAS